MLSKITESLKLKTNTSNPFSIQINSTYDDLKIAIEGYGNLTVPISPKAAKNLIKCANSVQFGWRDQTLQDPKVRKGWEIPKNLIKIDQPSWNETLLPALDEVKKELKIPENSNLSAQLHNLLIYESGDFFAGHQDSEKEDGMIGTLIVLLPSDFRGGSFVINQHGDKMISTRPTHIKETLTFIAFYADCHHEVKKVTSGYRIALTYNLILKNAPSLPRATNEKLTNTIQEYFETPEIKEQNPYRIVRPRWLIYLLDHEYTQKSLNWKQLKGADRERAAQFLNVAQKLGLEIHLALADIHETWDTESDDYYERDRYSRYRSRYWGKDEDDDEDEDDNDEGTPENVLATDLLNNECELRYWINRNGEQASFEANYSVDMDMMCWKNRMRNTLHSKPNTKVGWEIMETA